jgi:hypothetical protein
VLESTLNRPFAEGKMTPTRLKVGEVPCLLSLQKLMPFPSVADPE